MDATEYTVYFNSASSTTTVTGRRTISHTDTSRLSRGAPPPLPRRPVTASMVPYIAMEAQSQESQDEEDAREEFEVESLLTGRWVELLTALFIGDR